MILRRLPLLLASMLVAAAAHAQLGIYATAGAQRVSNITYTAGSQTSTSAEINPVGGTFGAYYDFKSFGPMRLGADVRGVIGHSTKGAYTTSNAFGTHMYSALGGVRLSFNTPIKLLHPYVEGAGGLARTNYGTQYALANNFEYHGYAGLDIRVAPILDIRLFELGYGGLSSSTPTSRNYPVKSVSIGAVLRLPF